MDKVRMTVFLSALLLRARWFDGAPLVLLERLLGHHLSLKGQSGGEARLCDDDDLFCHSFLN